jgi:hypothetical protein
MSSISSFCKLFECSGLAESVMWFMISYKLRQTHLSWLRNNNKMTFFQYKSSWLPSCEVLFTDKKTYILIAFGRLSQQ